MGAATLPPWLTPWSGGLVYAPQQYKTGSRLRDPRPYPRLTIFTYGHTNNDPLLRYGAGPEHGAGVMSDGSPPPLAAGPVPPPPGGMHWERVPLDRAPWHIEVPVLDKAHPLYDITSHSDEDIFESGAGAGPGGVEETATLAAMRAYGSVLRGWAYGAAVLAVLLLLVRLGERLLDWKFTQRRRRQHRERQRARANAGVEACHGARAPPPYSACLPPGGLAAGGKGSAERPPPYSGRASPFYIVRLLKACGIRFKRSGVRPPPTVVNSGFGLFGSRTMDWAAVSLTARRDLTPVVMDPPPVYSTADPTPKLTDAKPTVAGAQPDDKNVSPASADVARNDPDVDPLGAEAGAAPKNGSIGA